VSFSNLKSLLAGTSFEGRIFWTSVLLLYAEIFAIRWIGIEVSFMRAFPNLILLVILVGASLGLGSPEKYMSPKWALLCASTVLLLGLVFAAPLKLYELSFHLEQANLIAGMAASSVVLLAILTSLLVIATSMGAKLGKEISLLPGLKGYSMNLLGNIFGVFVFMLISYFHMPPFVWISILGIITWFSTRFKHCIALTVVLAGLSLVTTMNSHWSPYSKLDVLPLSSAEDSILGKGNYVLNSNNHYFHFAVRSLGLKSKEEKEKLEQESVNSPQLATLNRYFQWLKLPFQNSREFNRVLVLGGGSGNDVSFALQNNATSVDVVEIDPIIASFGKNLHPEKPYNDSRVRLHVEDARTFLRYATGKYDLIEFAYLDPGTTLHTASFLRVDNFVYTVESIRSALDHLDTNGLGVISFATGPNSLVTRRLYQAIKTAQGGKPPLGVVSDEWDSVMFFFGPAADKMDLTRMDLGPLRPWPSAKDLTDSRPASDDWPFLYLDFNSNGFLLYAAVLFAAVLMPVLILRRSDDGGPISGSTWGNMFFLGQAFMLVETKSITQLSLLFGATWIVTSIVTLVVLCFAFFANWLAIKRKGDTVWPFYLAILFALLLDFFFQIPTNSNLPFFVLAVLAAIINCLPIFFGGMIFSTCFRKANSPSACLSANLLGVAIGGLTENLCIVTGIKCLVLVALLLYAMSYLALLIGSQSKMASK
jgi:hypothetical protein